MAAWDKGFNFRQTAGGVVDGPNETYVYGGASSYPQTRNGVTFGYASGSSGMVSRDVSRDRRFVGTHRLNSVSFAPGYDFRIDLPAAGLYALHLGGTDSANQALYYEVLDTASSLYQSPLHTWSGGNARVVCDANGTLHGDAAGADNNGIVAWSANSTPKLFQFATNICIVRMKYNDQTSHVTQLSHMRLVQINPRYSIFRSPVLSVHI